MRALLVILLAGTLNLTGYAQTAVSTYDQQNVFINKGDYYFSRNEYKKAIVYYNMAFKKDNNYYSVLRKAEAFTALKQYDKAVECYRIVFNSDLQVTNKHRLNYALLLLDNRNITGYEKWLSKYNEIVRSEIYDYTTSKEVRAKMYYDTTIVVVDNELILNTPASDISPIVYNNQVIFASNRTNLLGSNGTDDYDVYTAGYLDDGQLGRLSVYNHNLNTDGNESALFISNNDKLYFTRSTADFSSPETYVASVPANNNAAINAKKLVISGYNVGQPALNSDGTKMYFVSDAAGGSGGFDIYISHLAGNKWGTPINLGDINTSGNEMYPFVLNDSILYFSSEGHNSIGGYDLYSFNLNQRNAKPHNLGRQVNTTYNDYALTFSPTGFTGYFCSDRPGGLGKEDIYRLHLVDIKKKYPAYQFKPRPFIEDDKINLYLSDGEEYNITSEDKTGFNFSFEPEEPYKMVIQHENPLAENILKNDKLSTDQREKQFLAPKPKEQTEIPLQPGMKYQFTAGMEPISSIYKSELKDMAGEYEDAKSSTIDLTALAKELLLTEGEIYTIQFVKDNSRKKDEKNEEPSTLAMNNETVNVNGRAFFIMLPLDIEANFNIKTDINHFKETFNPRKVGGVRVDTAAVIEKKVEKEWEGFPILVNTEMFSDVNREISATELIIIPGTFYILSLTKYYPGTTEEVEIVVPMTKGVRYNLGTDALNQADYEQALAKMAAQSGDPNAELIDISVLSKELDITPGDSILFSLIPAKKMAAQSGAKYVMSTLDVDGRKYYVPNTQKLKVKLKLDESQKVNIQTDLAHVKENFDPSTITLNVDTSSLSSNIVEEEKKIITDPVFEVVVVNFDLNKYEVRPEAKTILEDKVIEELKNDQRLYVTIKGYTDPMGDAAYNERLSRNRAQAVKDYLAGYGIGENRIRTFSFGETQSLQKGKDWDELSEEELQEHRKVEIVMYLPK
ncbi:MAG: OmpA family protein [Bacteroidetes bacterium]|jgi:outer membrane protein OmpA-like peptidoglycan-associated protein/tetratricopeptide (TPR) repeat protein|nr:OmpA family protein [Bacteroidota bacterium]